MYASQTNTPQVVKHDTDIFTTMNHGYINQTVTATYQTQTYRFTHRDITCKTSITRMKANVGVLLTVALVSLSHASASEHGRRKKASDVIRLLGNV